MGGDFLAAVDENERKERLRNAFVSLLLPRPWTVTSEYFVMWLSGRPVA
jgi:hypothetical protein